MAVTGIQGTNAPNIIIQNGVSGYSFEPADEKTTGFGTIAVKYESCQAYDLGSTVFFNKKNSVRFSSGNDIYFVVDEKDILFTETIAL